MLVNLGANNDVTVTGTVDLGATDNAVLDSAVALLTTIDADTSNLSVVGGGTEAAAIRVTIANNSTGVLSVDDNGGALTVDGTVTAELSATDNAVLDAIAASVAGTLTVGAHAVTNAGTFAVQVDGAALTALQLIDDAVFAEDVAAQAADKGIAVLAVRRDADTALVGADNDYANLQVDANGYLKVEIFDGGGSHTVDGTVTANLGATDNAVLDSIQAAVEIIDNAISGSEMQVDVVAALPAGTNAIGNVGIVPRTSGGMTIFRSLDIDESEEEIKATAGQLFSISAFNRTAAPLYLKFYNLTAANTNVGTSTPVLTFVVPANADSDGAGFIWNNEIGFAFSTAISVACTTGVADADTGAPGANDCVVNVGYA